MGIKERKQRDYRLRKALILKTAQGLFSSRGFHGTTLSDIARRIEFSKGTIYSHFNSKEEIYAEILLNQLNRLWNQLKKIAVNRVDTAEGIRQSLRCYIDFYLHNREYFKLLFFFDLMSNHYRIPADLRKDIQARKISCLFQLQAIIRPDLESDAPLREIAFVLWGMLNGIIQLIDTSQIQSSELERLTDIGFDIVTRGIIRKNHSNVR